VTGRAPKGGERIALGRRGEAWALGHLEALGFRILETNYRCPLGEIDVVAERGGALVFVEVKTRQSHRYGRPEEAVGFAKQRRLTRLAQWYRKERGRADASASFAVLAVTWSAGGRPEARLIENAFQAGDLF
jgi:putative endonuclease